MTGAASHWPPYAHIVVDGMRIGWRAPIVRTPFDDGAVRQAMTGGNVTREVTFDVLVDSDDDRKRFDDWVAALGSGADLIAALPPEGTLSTYRLVGGRGGVRWTGMGTAGTRRWWRAQMTCERQEAPPLILAPVQDQAWKKDRPIDPLTLPAAVNGLAPVRYQLLGAGSPAAALPAGLVFDAPTRTLSGTPTHLQGWRTYRWVATDALGSEAAIEFRMAVGESIFSGLTGIVAARALSNASSSHVLLHARRQSGDTNRRFRSTRRTTDTITPLSIIRLGGIGSIGGTNPVLLPSWAYSGVARLYVRRISLGFNINEKEGNESFVIGTSSSKSGSDGQISAASLDASPGLALAWRIGGEYRYFGQPGFGAPADAGPHPYRTGAVFGDPDEIADIKRLHARMATAGNGSADVALIWVGAGSVIYTPKGLTFGGGGEPPTV